MTESPSFVETGRRVIAAEAEALGTLRDSIGPGFSEAAEMILRATGRIIVTGIGKSGHIAKKIAATFASTGTPAQFVHPAEASHGDLGMITRADVVLAISNSGEAPELANLLAYSRRFEIPLIGMTSRPDSTLARHADLVLTLPQAGEACGTGVVPSNSTTMSLALGDALAIALMHHRRFTAENFRDFHPGGKLGAQLSRVSDLMHSGKALPIVSTGTPMGEALLVMSQKSFGVVAVTDKDGKLLGVVTDGDLRRNMPGLLERTVDDVMTQKPKTIQPDALAQEAVAQMSGRVTCLFVVTKGSEGEEPVGLIHIHDCLRAGIG